LMPLARFSRCLRRWWKGSFGVNQAIRSRGFSAFGVELLEDRSVPATTISISDASIAEPAANGTANLVFTLTRVGDLTDVLALHYATVAGTAQPGVDFAPTTGFATFLAGDATITVSVPVFGTGAFHFPNLTFSVVIPGIAGPIGPPFDPPQIFETEEGPYSVA